MARIDRKRRRNQGGLTDAQQQILAYGFVLIPNGSAEFENDAEMLSKWRRHCGPILEEHCRPGARPWAYYRFDIKLEKPPLHWYEEIRILREHGLLDAREMFAIEGERIMLNPSQPEGLCSSFGDPARIKAMGIGGFTLRNLEAEFLLAIDWHTWRGRPEPAEKYLNLAATVHSVLAVEAEKAHQGQVQRVPR